jgi:hypothetical protein
MNLLKESHDYFKKCQALSGTIEAWHCGRDLQGGSFSLDYLRTGEGVNYLGPGIYFIDSKQTALRYARYVDKAFIYKCSFSVDGLYDSNRGQPVHLREKMQELNDKLVKDFGLKNWTHVDPSSSFKYGKHTIGFLNEKFGRDKALSILKEIGINGAYEVLPGGETEYCIFDTGSIQVIDKATVEKQ